MNMHLCKKNILIIIYNSVKIKTKVFDQNNKMGGKMKKEFKFKVNALRTLSSPYKNGENMDLKSETVYYLLVNMNDLPSDLPSDVNPRVPKMGTNVAKRLINAVIEPETDFYLNNRGIVISAKEFSFDSKILKSG